MTALLRWATVAGAVVATIALLHHVAGVPASDMSASRIVPAIALARGLPIYAGPDAGPIIDFMYGPVAALAFLPAALAPAPSGALAIAILLNVAWFFGPMAWLHRRAGAGRDLAWAGFALLVLWTLRDPGLVFSALTVHADAPALGLGACACGLVLAGRLRAAALAVVLAAAAKQTMAPLALALVAFVAARDGVRAALRTATWLAALGAAAAVVALAAFGPAPLVFNMVTLPARMPWYGEATTGGWGAVGFPPGRWATVGFTATLLARLAWLPALVAAATLVAAGRRAAPAALLAAAAVVLAPIAIVSAAKVGGYFNTFSVSTYFLVAAATVGLVRAADAGGRGATIARALLIAGLVACAIDVGRGPAGMQTAGETVARLRSFADNPQERAFRAARAHPGEVGLPWNPLALLLAEGRLDNNEIGAWNRDLAGVAIPDALWRHHQPPRLRYLAFRPPSGAFAWLPAPAGRLPEFAVPATLPGLEGWTVLAPALAAPPPARQENDPHVAPPPPHS